MRSRAECEGPPIKINKTNLYQLNNIQIINISLDIASSHPAPEPLGFYTEVAGRLWGTA
jgi:hypothetical protein